MKPAQVQPLESQLAQLSQWNGDAPEMWQRALSVSEPPLQRSVSSILSGLSRKAPSWAFPVIGVAATFIVLIPFLFPVVSATRHQAKQSPAAMSEDRIMDEDKGARRSYDRLIGTDSASGRWIGSPSSGDAADELRNRPAEGSYSTVEPLSPRKSDTAQARSLPASTPPAASEANVQRHVVRKATIELTAPDVRAAFLKASQLISEARSEYVQDSALTGAGNQLQANLTLRVAADRLSAVLNELRQLGDVRSERSDGQDVTTQVVDLEARLRNEQRVEAELLNLLETRKDAPLKEILDLRANLNTVRTGIEQLTAQRQTLARLVSLATILVIIRPPDAPVALPPVPAGIGAYFGESAAAAWQKGLHILADTLAVVLGALIGGLPWWVLITIVVVLLRAMRRRSRATDGRPSP